VGERKKKEREIGKGERRERERRKEEERLERGILKQETVLEGKYDEMRRNISPQGRYVTFTHLPSVSLFV
jgi:hypothetical protein